MKKFLALLLIIFLTSNVTFASVDRLSQEYLQNTKHFTLTKPLAEMIAKRALKKALKKETGTNFDVKFEGYTTSSIKRGVFKSIEIEGKDVNVDNVVVPYVHFKSLDDYNYIDYTKNPIVFKCDMTYTYDIILDEDAINTALKDSDYKKVISKVNRISRPFFVIKGVRTKIIDNKLYIVTDYNLPIAITKDRSFVAKSDFEVVNGIIKAKNVSIDTSYGNLGLNKVANLINFLNPLEFTLNVLNSEKQKTTIENINIVDNKVRVDGKIYVKGEDK
jgi:hypothetical protein